MAELKMKWNAQDEFDKAQSSKVLSETEGKETNTRASHANSTHIDLPPLTKSELITKSQ